MFKFAVISFPGTNCENELVRAFRRNEMEAEIVLWNDTGVLDGSRLNEFSGYAIAGGFSYEDRGRSGVIAAQDPITEILKQEADKGKVILGICNGAQILVETGLIPGYENKALGLALAWNEMRKGNEIVDTGFYNDWAHLKNCSPKSRTPFNNFDDLLFVPFAHGEGRFVMEEELLKKLEANDQVVFKYCDEKGRVDSHYPITPNGAMASTAALCNPMGNVMAIMPHPERDPKGGNGNLVFQSIKNYLEAESQPTYQSLGIGKSKNNVESKKNYDLEFYIRLIITDNTERSIEEALHRKGLPVNLERYEFYGINLNAGVELKEAVQKILHSGELANFNKHLVYLKIGNETFQYDVQKKLVLKLLNLDHFVIAVDESDLVGQAKKTSLNAHSGPLIKNAQYGVLWNFNQAGEGILEKVIDTKILYNPYSMIMLKP